MKKLFIIQLFTLSLAYASQTNQAKIKKQRQMIQSQIQLEQNNIKKLQSKIAALHNEIQTIREQSEQGAFAFMPLPPSYFNFEQIELNKLRQSLSQAQINLDYYTQQLNQLNSKQKAIKRLSY